MNAPQLEQLNFNRIRYGVDAEIPEPRRYNEDILFGGLQTLWDQRWRIILIVAAALALATAFLLVTPKQYTAESVVRLRFDTGSDPTAVARISLDPAAVIESEARILRSRSMAEKTVERLGLADDPSFTNPTGPAANVIGTLRQLLQLASLQPATTDDPQTEALARATANVVNRTAVENDNKSYLVTVKFTSGSPVVAATVANELVQTYLRERLSQHRHALIARQRAEVAQLAERFGERHPSLANARRRLADMESQPDAPGRGPVVHSVSVENFTAEIAIGAIAPSFPSAPKAKTVYGLASLIGIVSAVVIVFLLQARDRGVTSERSAVDITGVRVLGMIPSLSEKSPDRQERMRDAARSIWIAAGFDAQNSACTVVTIASSVADEGKTPFAFALANIIAEMGGRVLVLDEDPRSAGGAFGAEDPFTRGRDGNPAYALCRYKAMVLHELRNSSVSLKQYIAQARHSYDVILVKAPPVLLHPDAIRYGRVSDVVLFLVRWRKAKCEAIAAAANALRSAGVRITGTVLTDVPARALPPGLAPRRATARRKSASKPSAGPRS